MIRLLLSASALLALTACYKVTYVVDPSVPENPSYDEWHKSAIFGLTELDEPVPLSTICPEGVARFTHQLGVKEACVSACTFQLFNPAQVLVTCKGGQAWDVQMGDDGMVYSAQPVAAPGL